MKSNLETEWEASRKTHRKRWRIIFYILIPLTVVGGIIFYNNRDLLNDESSNTETVGVTEKDTVFRDSAESSERTTVSAGITNPPTITESVPESDLKAKAVRPVQPSESPKDSTGSVQQLKGSGNAEGTGQSEVISNISCRINDKAGIIVRVSLELFYREPSDRSQILIRRDQIRVVVQKLLRYKDLGFIKKDRIEPELTNAINEIFNRTVCNKLEIKDMQIEKVQKP